MYEDITEVVRMKLGSKTTPVLLLSESDYNKIKDWFDEQGRPCDSRAERIGGGAKGGIKYSWSLHLNKFKRRGRYSMWGISGDSTFGDAPRWVTKQYFGNIHAANEVYTEFLKKVFNSKKYVGKTFTFIDNVSSNDYIQPNNIFNKIVNNIIDKYYLDYWWFKGDTFTITEDYFYINNIRETNYYTIKWLKHDYQNNGYILKESVEKLLKSNFIIENN